MKIPPFPDFRTSILSQDWSPGSQSPARISLSLLSRLGVRFQPLGWAQSNLKRSPRPARRAKDPARNPQEAAKTALRRYRKTECRQDPQNTSRIDELRQSEMLTFCHPLFGSFWNRTLCQKYASILVKLLRVCLCASASTRMGRETGETQALMEFKGGSWGFVRIRAAFWCLAYVLFLINATQVISSKFFC